MLGAPLVLATEDQGAPEKVRLVEPQVIIAVEHVQDSGDVVQMHFSGAVYDQPSVEAAVSELATTTGSQIKNFQYIPAPTPEDVTKVFFVTQNLIDASTGDIRLQPIVRAFMKGAKGKVESLSVRIIGMRPNPYTTLAGYTSDAVSLRGFFDAASQSIEYRILVLADSPSKVQIPPRHIPDETFTQGFESQKDDRTPLLLGLILLAGASAGALVYFALLGKRS